MRSEPSSLESSPSMRLDKWLKMARIFKSREEAARMCELGRVKLNEHEAKASKVVHAGDKVVVKIEKQYRELEIKGIPKRGLSAKDAKLVYHEEAPLVSPETEELMRLMKQESRRVPSPEKGRPTKKRRREIDRWHGQ